MDQDIIACAIQKPARYIGLIGSDTKWARFRQRLEAKGMPARQVGRVRRSGSNGVRLLIGLCLHAPPAL